MVITQKIRNIKFQSIVEKNSFLTKGSESYLYHCDYINLKSVVKERKQKKYRNSKIDKEIRLSRMRLEARMMKLALNYKLRVPAIYAIDLANFTLIIEFINGESLADYVNSNISNNLTKIINFLMEFGKLVAKLHSIDIIHSDLTPYNIIITSNHQIYLIDFGLAYYSNENKDKVMDIFIMFGSLSLFEIDKSSLLFNSFLKGYLSYNTHGDIINQLNILINKGRYKKIDKVEK